MPSKCCRALSNAAIRDAASCVPKSGGWLRCSTAGRIVHSRTPRRLVVFPEISPQPGDFTYWQ